MEKSIVHKICRIFIVLLGCALLTGIARAETLHLIDGKTATGDVVSVDGEGVVLKQADGTYADKLLWTKISQDDLRQLQQNPKFAQFVEPFIEPSPEEKGKRPEIEVKEVPHLARPPKGSFIAAMFTSGLGLFTLFVVYVGNLFAAYEISIFRAQPAALVCGISAVVPVLGPIIFLSIPARAQSQKKEASWTAPAPPPAEEGVDAVIAADQAAEQAAIAEQAQAAAVPNLPPTKTFARGQFTFNRRFFETQLTPFFAMTRPEAEQDKILTFKTARGTFIVQRISRISANDITLQVQKGPASEDVVVPFVEVQEVQVKHKDA